MIKCPFDQKGHLIDKNTKSTDFPKNFFLLEFMDEIKEKSILSEIK